MKTHMLENEQQLENTKRKLRLIERQIEDCKARADGTLAWEAGYESLLSLAKQFKEEIIWYECSSRSPRNSLAETVAAPIR